MRSHNKDKVHQAISFEEFITCPPHKHTQTYGYWSWQWKAMTSLIDSIPPCCVQFLCAIVTLFSSIFCFSEKFPSLFLRSFRITTWRKNTSGGKKSCLVQQQLVFLFQEMSIQRNTLETPAYCFTVGVSVNQLINTGAIFSSKDLDQLCRF